MQHLTFGFCEGNIQHTKFTMLRAAAILKRRRPVDGEFPAISEQEPAVFVDTLQRKFRGWSFVNGTTRYMPLVAEQITTAVRCMSNFDPEKLFGVLQCGDVQLTRSLLRLAHSECEVLYDGLRNRMEDNADVWQSFIRRVHQKVAAIIGTNFDHQEECFCSAELDKWNDSMVDRAVVSQISPLGRLFALSVHMPLFSSLLPAQDRDGADGVVRTIIGKIGCLIIRKHAELCKTGRHNLLQQIEIENCPLFKSLVALLGNVNKLTAGGKQARILAVTNELKASGFDLIAADADPLLEVFGYCCEKRTTLPDPLKPKFQLSRQAEIIKGTPLWQENNQPVTRIPEKSSSPPSQVIKLEAPGVLRQEPLSRGGEQQSEKLTTIEQHINALSDNVVKVRPQEVVKIRRKQRRDQAVTGDLPPRGRLGDRPGVGRTERYHPYKPALYPPGHENTETPQPAGPLSPATEDPVTPETPELNNDESVETSDTEEGLVVHVVNVPEAAGAPSALQAEWSDPYLCDYDMGDIGGLLGGGSPEPDGQEPRSHTGVGPPDGSRQESRQKPQKKSGGQRRRLLSGPIDLSEEMSYQIIFP